MSDSSTGPDERRVLRITGDDAKAFLQGIVTNDVDKLKDGLVYAALLSPQGKYLFDFFLFLRDGEIHLDASEAQADALMQRLSMYKLRARVEFETVDLKVERGIDETRRPRGAFSDPRHEELGWRFYSGAGEQDGLPGSNDSPPSRRFAPATGPQTADIDWTAIRVANCIPETGIELVSNSTYILEAGFERLNGVDFAKGCYVGQEVTARMRHKTRLRKGLAVVNVDGAVPVGTEIRASGRVAGTLFSQARGKGIAYLRFDRMSGEMSADGVKVRPPEA
ncbi:MAG: folate-binding protein [Rhodobacteraceae bacterium]|nr:folate-binding protein [Paracoccaceae bacterium]MCY4137816.1 folate-binding protein [Paracoccaceae bacterium]